MKKKYAIILVNECNKNIIKNNLFESDDINECLTKMLDLVFSGYKADCLRLIEIMPVSIHGQITARGEKYASKTFG